MGGAIWIAGALVSQHARIVIWVVALALDYAGPAAGYWTPGLGATRVTDWELEHSHFAERFQLFVIIALGESIVTTGASAAELDLDGGRGLALVVAFVLGAALWWLYFDEVAGRSAEDFAAAGGARGQLGRDAYTYLHVPIVAGIILAAAGAAALAFGLTGADVPAVVPGAVIAAMLAGLAVIETIGRLSRGTGPDAPGGARGEGRS